MARHVKKMLNCHLCVRARARNVTAMEPARVYAEATDVQPYMLGR